jgi:preprotein translocase subunit SecB
MVVKPSPDTYDRIMNGLELKKLYVESFSGHIDLEALTKAKKALAVSISSNADFRSKSKNEVEITQKWDIVAKDRNSRSECLNISVTYCLIMNSKEKFTKSFFGVFEATSLGFNMWPFVREFVNNMTARMNVPPLTLPLFKTSP